MEGMEGMKGTAGGAGREGGEGLCGGKEGELEKEPGGRTRQQLRPRRCPGRGWATAAAGPGVAACSAGPG